MSRAGSSTCMLAAHDLAAVHDELAASAAACRRPRRAPRRRLDHAAIAHLPAALGVEGRLLDDHLDRVARVARGHRSPPTSSASDVRVAPRARRSRGSGSRSRRRAASRAGPTRSSPLPFHAARARSRCSSIAASKPAWSKRERRAREDVLGEIDREAERVVELEHHVARKRARAALRELRRPRPRAARGPSRASRGSAPPRGGRGP